MLDEADFRKRYDKDDLLNVITSQPAQLLHEFEPIAGLQPERIKRVMVAGMGGSALASELVKNWLSDRLPWPIEIVRDYQLPVYVDEQTLVVCSSFSGSSEETLAALEVALQQRAQVVVMAAGGALLELARKRTLPHYALPGVIQGRYGVLSGVRAWAQLIQSLGAAEGLVDELEGAVTAASRAIETWSPHRLTAENEAKQMAEALLGNNIVVYAGPTLAAMAQKWKVDFNENAKTVAFWNVLPEMNHNELSGWAHPAAHACKIIELMSELDHPQVNKRFEVMNRLLSDRWAPIKVDVAGATRAQQMVWTFMLGSFTSAYLALLNQTDIGALPLVPKLKEQL